MLDYQKLKKIEIKNLGRQDLGSSLKFEEIIPNLEKIKEYLLFFEGKENTLTNIEKEPVVNIYNEFIELVNSIKDFAVNVSESHEQTQSKRTAILKKIHALHKTSNEKILSLVTYLKLNNTEILETIKSTQNKIVQIDNQFTTKLQNFDSNVSQKNSEFNNIIQKAEKTLSEAQQIKNNTENFSVKKLVERYGDIFSKQSRKNSKLAKWSLSVFIISLFLLGYFTIWLFSPLIKELMNFEDDHIALSYTLTNIIFRLTLLGMASVLVKESLKSFNVNMHLYNLNQHRQNALLSFETLITNTDSRETRDHIIKEIAQTIYANQDDGYLRTGKKTIDTTQIIELIKTLK